MPAHSRGALIVLEGMDKSGKSTQCAKLVEALIRDGKRAELLKFPARETATGKLASDYLQNKCGLEDHAIHLIFTANRWEHVPKMLQQLNSGVTLIVDRYSFSGVAYSAVKRGMDIRWCKQPERGLPKPDSVLYLNLPVEVAAQRGAFGEERYETREIQSAISNMFKQLVDSTWTQVDADKPVEELHLELKKIVCEVITTSENSDIGQLWMNDDDDDKEKK